MRIDNLVKGLDDMRNTLYNKQKDILQDLCKYFIYYIQVFQKRRPIIFSHSIKLDGYKLMYSRNDVDTLNYLKLFYKKKKILDCSFSVYDDLLHEVSSFDRDLIFELKDFQNKLIKIVEAEVIYKLEKVSAVEYTISATEELIEENN